MWNYLATPFIFVRNGFDIEELSPHDEDGQQWRVLQVRYPKDIPAHCDTQQFYFNSDGLLKRMDYTTDVLGGVASHYLYDPKNFAGLVVPTRRRVVQRTSAGPKITGITAGFPRLRRRHDSRPVKMLLNNPRIFPQQSAVPKSMRAIAVEGGVGPARVLKLASTPKPCEILIRVAAAGVNYSDIVQREGNYPLPPGTPETQGLEISGTIVSVAADVQRIRVGDPVCAPLLGGG
jgi:hypothetical protein